MTTPPDKGTKRTLKFIDEEPIEKVITDDVEVTSETEIVTEIIVPEEGRWGWVVVAGSFMNCFILEGIFFTFGSIYNDISQDLQADVSSVTVINSVNIALLYITGPVASAFVNRFGFRICVMIGSIIVSSAYLTSYLAGGYVVLLIFNGVISGIGGCFIIMSSQLVVSFYFERLRAIAVAIAGLGTNLGVTVMYRVNTFLIELAGWRVTTLFHAGLIGNIYFIAMVYRPLLSLSVKNEAEDVQTLTYLPSLSTVAIKASRTQTKEAIPVTTRTEKLFSAVSNVHFPTVADVVGEVDADANDNEAGPSSSVPQTTPKLTLEARQPRGGISQRQLKQVQSIMSRKSLVDNEKQIKITFNNIELKKKRRWWKCCHWEGHVKETRPMYRDDAFYQGTVQNLPAYEKQVTSTRERRQTGFEYQMAVSRAVAASDLQERKGICTTSVRRVLATMMDPQLLKRNSFFMVCISSFLLSLGSLVPLIFVPDRAKSEGIEDVHCNTFISAIGLSGAIGRVIAGLIGCKLNPIKIYSVAALTAGTALIISNLTFNVYYQYFCYVLFGLATAHISSLRSLVLVNLYGLEKLTNATGMLLMFQGFGCLISTPIAGALKGNFGYKASFYTAGTFMVIGGLVIMNVKMVAKSEDRKAAKMVVGKYSSVIKRKRSIKSKSGNLAPIPEKQ